MGKMEFDPSKDKMEEEVSLSFSLSFEEIRNRFLQMIPKKAKVMDFGCGSGGDTLFFKEHGCIVTPVEPSKILCNIASKHTGLEVTRMRFLELKEVRRYDGIWASSSIHHLPYEQLVTVLKKLNAALKPDGILYVSFQYGTFEGVRNGRTYTDMNEVKIRRILREVKGFTIEEMTVTPDIRPDRKSIQWMNLFLKKINE